MTKVALSDAPNLSVWLPIGGRFDTKKLVRVTSVFEIPTANVGTKHRRCTILVSWPRKWTMAIQTDTLSAYATEPLLLAYSGIMVSDQDAAHQFFFFSLQNNLRHTQRLLWELCTKKSRFEPSGTGYVFVTTNMLLPDRIVLHPSPYFSLMHMSHTHHHIYHSIMTIFYMTMQVSLKKWECFPVHVLEHFTQLISCFRTSADFRPVRNTTVMTQCEMMMRAP
jgi:hypothetical protein